MEAVLATALQRMFPDDFLAAHPAIAEERKASLRAANPKHFAAACRALARFDQRTEIATIRNPSPRPRFAGYGDATGAVL